MSNTPEDGAYVAALWEHPALCVALFGVQFRTEAGRHLYEEARIDAEMTTALETARGEGLLLHRALMSPEGPVFMQYWQSYDVLDRWARKQPHSRWWRWLLEHQRAIGFYHEIYQVKAAEAIYEEGTRPVGPALFSSLRRVKGGEGHSRDRQGQFMEEVQKAHPEPEKD